MLGAVAAQGQERSPLDDFDFGSASEAEFATLVDALPARGHAALLAQAYMQRCHALVGGDIAAARAVAEAGLALDAAPADRASRGGLRACRGYLSERQGELDAAFADYDAAVHEAEAAGDAEGLAQARVLRGEIQYRRGNLSESLVDLLAAYRAYVDLDNARQQGYALNAIANLYADARVGQYERALDYYRQLLQSHSQAGRARDTATAQFNIGSTLQSMGRFVEAEASFAQALDGFAALADADSVAETRRALAALALRQQRFQEALDLADQALAQAGSASDPMTAASARLTRGVALLRLGRLDVAEQDLDAARSHFEAAGDERFLERTLGELAELKAAQGDWVEAYRLRTAQRALGDRLSAGLNDEITSRLRVQFDAERKDQENAALKREGELREAALRDAERIRDLRGTVIALGALVLLGVIGLAWAAALHARRMRRLALTDELTGLPNRRAILQRLRQKLVAGSGAAVLMFDIDRFKSINDSLGHDIGDVVLRAVALAVARELGAGGDIGRIGGEEFLVLSEARDRSALAEIAERLRRAVESIELDGPAAGLRVSISLGGALALGPSERAEGLLKRADEAVYRAKQAGRNRVELASA